MRIILQRCFSIQGLPKKVFFVFWEAICKLIRHIYDVFLYGFVRHRSIYPNILEVIAKKPKLFSQKQKSDATFIHRILSKCKQLLKFFKKQLFLLLLLSFIIYKHQLIYFSNCYSFIYQANYIASTNIAIQKFVYQNNN